MDLREFHNKDLYASGNSGISDTDLETNLRPPYDIKTSTIPLTPVPPTQNGTQPIYELGVDCFFNARHYSANGSEGPVHPHSWRVEARLTAQMVNEHGMLVGFAEAKQLVQQQVNRFNGTILNEIQPFTAFPPTAENIAAVLYREINSVMNLPTLKLISVCVWESPTNYVLYREIQHGG